MPACLPPPPPPPPPLLRTSMHDLRVLAPPFLPIICVSSVARITTILPPPTHPLPRDCARVCQERVGLSDMWMTCHIVDSRHFCFRLVSSLTRNQLLNFSSGGEGCFGFSVPPVLGWKVHAFCMTVPPESVILPFPIWCKTKEILYTQVFHFRPQFLCCFREELCSESGARSVGALIVTLTCCFGEKTMFAGAIDV